MKTSLKQSLPLISAILFVVFGYAQDAQFSQYYANRIYLNPAYAGGAKCPNVILGYRNQASELAGNFVTKSISYDQYSRALKGGVGINVMQDVQGEGNFRTTNLSMVYSYVFNVTKSLSVRTGFKGSYFQNSVQWDKFTFADMVDYNQGGFTNATQEVNYNNGGSSGVDLAFGAIVNYNNMYGGLAVNHLTEPNQYLMGWQSTLTRSYVLHGGMLLEYKLGSDNVTFSPNFLIQMQGGFKQINTGFYASKNGVIGGVWYRHKDAVAFLIGFDQKRYKVGYSYDFNISKIGSVINSGAHEVSFTYKLKCKRKVTKYTTAACPTF